MKRAVIRALALRNAWGAREATMRRWWCDAFIVAAVPMGGLLTARGSHGEDP
jgi:hypothetical protein